MNGWLDEKVFSSGIESLPLVSIDLIVRCKESGRYLFGWRRNRPAANHWFVPGGRVQKNESIDDAFARLVKAELGFDESRSTAKWLGLYEHFYDDYVFGEGVSTHYVVLAYSIFVEKTRLKLPREQHSDYSWMSEEQIRTSDRVHPYCKAYLNCSDLSYP